MAVQVKLKDIVEGMHFPHSTQFSGKASTPSRIHLKWCSITLILGHQLPRPSDLRVTMRTTVRQTRENRTITIDFQNEAT